MKNSRLLEAKKNKFDEFYTAKEDIEKNQNMKQNYQ